MLSTPLSIAPMVDWTYTHFRVFMRLLAPRALLYTEMLSPFAVLRNPAETLVFHPQESPLALQLGGSCPEHLAKAAKIAQEQGFHEVNLNLGCPSDKVKKGQFGACMMSMLPLVQECISAIKTSVAIPVSAKLRTGVDMQDSYAFFSHFAKSLVKAGCDKLIVHARKAWLTGLNPKQNRTIPPLQYDYVYRLKQELPDTPLVINGNISSTNDVHTHMQKVDGVMVGRLACQNPYAIAELHRELYPTEAVLSPYEALQAYVEYAVQQKVPASILIKPLQNLAYGLPMAKKWKTHLQQIQQTSTISRINTSLLPHRP